MKKEAPILFEKENLFQDKCFMLELLEENIPTYASINADMAFNETELQPTGSYHIYYLHPKQGSTTFLLTVYGSEWESQNMPAYMQPGIIDKIVFAIHARLQQ